MTRQWDALQSVVYPELNEAQKASKISHEPMVWDAARLIKGLRKRIEELEARLAEYEATATLDPVIECPSCGLEINLAEEGAGP